MHKIRKEKQMKEIFEIEIILKIIKNIVLENFDNFTIIKNDLKYCQSLIKYLEKAE